MIDVTVPDDAYMNPWISTRVVALWMSLMLDEASGDLDLAVRAYRRGIGNARDSAGAAYSRRSVAASPSFIHNPDAYRLGLRLEGKSLRLRRRAWPWMDNRWQPRSQRTIAKPPSARCITAWRY